LLIFIALFPLAAFGQRLEFGVKVGVPLSEAFETGSFFTLGFGEQSISAVRRYTVGPVVEIALVRGFSVEFDALYRRLGFDDLTKSSGLEFDYTRTAGGTWDFPILGKFRFLHRAVVAPYVDGGVSFRRLNGVSSSTVRYFGGFYAQEIGRSTAGTSAILNARSSRGGAVGVGVNIRAWRLHISPEVRYTRWGPDRNLDPLLYSNQNQVDVLLGITF
jgi:hypothetical protein